MFHVVEPDRSYDPETVAAMTAAFDNVCQSVSARTNDYDDDLRQALALIILRLADEGERDPDRLADIAFREWIKADRWAIRGRSARG
jgi:hypothetical protein